MKLPFTTQQFYDVFRNYNHAVYPMQLVLMVLAALVILLLFKKSQNAYKAVLIIIAILWFWMGAVYHIVFFSAINTAAYGFGVLFIVQALLLLFLSVREYGAFAFRWNITGFSSIVLILYALVIYPLIGQYSGHAYPYAPTFGLPCPTTIFTLGVLLLLPYRLPWYIAIIPILWSVIGFSAAFMLGVVEDTALILAGILFVLLNSRKPSGAQLSVI